MKEKTINFGDLLNELKRKQVKIVFVENKGSFIQIDSFDDDTFSVINVCYDNKKRYFDNRIDYIKNKNDLFNAIDFSMNTIK